MDLESTTAPAEGDTSVDGAQAPQDQSQGTTGSEAENNSSEAMVPSHRVREATEARRQAEAERDELRQQLEEAQKSSSASTDDEVDPEVQTLVTKILEKGGYVKKDDVSQAVQASEVKRQYNEDVASLNSKYGTSGVPFKIEAVRSFANENGINITSKASLEAAYRQMNYDKIVEAERNAAITSFKEGGKNSTEKPGSEGASPPAEKEIRGLKNRIHAASSKLR